MRLCARASRLPAPGSGQGPGPPRRAAGPAAQRSINPLCRAARAHRMPGPRPAHRRKGLIHLCARASRLPAPGSGPCPGPLHHTALPAAHCSISYLHLTTKHALTHAAPYRSSEALPWQLHAAACPRAPGTAAPPSARRDRKNAPAATQLGLTTADSTLRVRTLAVRSLRARTDTASLSPTAATVAGACCAPAAPTQALRGHAGGKPPGPPPRSAWHSPAAIAPPLGGRAGRRGRRRRSGT